MIRRNQTTRKPVFDSLEPRLLLSANAELASLFAGAAELDVAPADSVSCQGTLDDRLAASMYRFTVPAGGRMYIEMSALGDGIDPYLQLFNDQQKRVARNNNASRATLDSRIRRSVKAGQTYYILAGSYAGLGGDFELRLTSEPTDDRANTAAAAWAMRLRGDGAGRAGGSVQYASDVDYYSFVATDTGLAEVSMDAWGRNNSLTASLTIYDAQENILAVTDAVGGGAAQTSFSIVQGQTYYMAASGQNSSTGRYRLVVLPTVPQEFVDAEELEAPVSGELVTPGVLAAGEQAGYMFTAAADGMAYAQAGTVLGSLDTVVEVFDSRMRRVAWNDNARGLPGTTDSCAPFRTKAGETYYIRVSGARGTSGTYGMRLITRPYDDTGNELAAARKVRLSATSATTMSRRIDYAADVDVFAMVAPVTGEIRADMAPYDGYSDVDSALTAYDAQGEAIIDDADPASAGASIVFDVVAGQTYYVSAASSDGGLGRYVLTFTVSEEPPAPPPPPPAPDPDPDPDPNPDPDPAPPPPPPAGGPTPGVVVAGYVVDDGGGTRLQIAGTDGNDTITLSWTGTAVRLVSQNGTQDFVGTFSSVAVYGFDGDDMLRTAWSLTMDVLIYAGAGNDVIYENAQGDAVIYAGAGDDLIVTVGGGTDTVYGQEGSDSFWGDSNDNIADASAAEIAAKAVHRIASFYQPYTTNPGSADYVSREINSQNITDPAYNSYAHGWYNFAASPLFADGPEYNDIRQGAVGDCYYLASLASLADTDPGVIRQMVTSLGDGTFAVRFYRDGQEVYLRLDADLPVSSGSSLAYAKLSGDGEIWVAIVEKAYAHFRYGQNTYDSISGGWMSTVYMEVTGASATTRWTGGSTSSLGNFLASELAAGHAVTLGSYSNSPSPIVGSHAYMVKSVESAAGQTYVTVYNPWGIDGRSYDSNYNDGLLRLTIDQVQTCFSAAVSASV